MTYTKYSCLYRYKGGLNYDKSRNYRSNRLCAGNEIVRLLLEHKDAEIVWYGSRSYIDKKYTDIYQNFFKLVDAKCMDDNMEALAEEADVIFTATPQGLCASLIQEEILSTS